MAWRSDRTFARRTARGTAMGRRAATGHSRSARATSVWGEARGSRATRRPMATGDGDGDAARGGSRRVQGRWRPGRTAGTDSNTCRAMNSTDRKRKEKEKEEKEKKKEKGEGLISKMAWIGILN